MSAMRSVNETKRRIPGSIPLEAAVLCVRCQMVGEALASGRCAYCGSKGVAALKVLLAGTPEALLPGETLRSAVLRVRQSIALQVLARHGNHHQRAATALGVHRNTMTRNAVVGDGAGARTEGRTQ